MNATIARIVELAFASAAPTQEMRELKEEVLANCQAHYEDLIARGKTPDEATDAVVQSLKGIEELIRSEQPAQDRAEEDAFEKKAPFGMEPLSFEPSGIRHIRMELTSADVEVNQGSRFDLELTNGSRSRIEAAMEGDTLVLRQVKINAEPNRQSLLQWLQISFLPHDECQVSMTLPENICPDAAVTTRNGNIFWGARSGNLRLNTTSGDIEAKLPKAACPDHVEIHTTSGDVTVTGSAGSWQVHTVNGDTEAHVHGESLVCTATNGDITIAGALRMVQVSTVNGDQELNLEDPACTQISMKAVSGDMNLTLPEGLQAIALNANTVSGDVSVRGVVNDPSAPCAVLLNSVSGDLLVKQRT